MSEVSILIDGATLPGESEGDCGIYGIGDSDRLAVKGPADLHRCGVAAANPGR